MEKKNKRKYTNENKEKDLNKLWQERFDEAVKEEKKRTTFYQEFKTDPETGEVKNTTNQITAKISKEPDFVKLYLRDLVVLNGLQGGNSDVLFELLQFLDYDSNVISINSYQKEQIAKRCNFKNERQVDTALTNLKKKGILLTVVKDNGKTARGTFELNPFICAKGKWIDTWKSRDIAKLTILYKRDKTTGTVTKTIQPDINEEEKGGE